MSKHKTAGKASYKGVVLVAIILIVLGLAVWVSIPSPRAPSKPETSETEETSIPEESKPVTPTLTPTPEESKQTYRIVITIWSRWYGAIVVMNRTGNLYDEHFDINGTTKRPTGTTITYKVKAGVEDMIGIEAYCIGNIDDDRSIIVSIEEDKLFGETLCTMFDNHEILLIYIIKTGEVKRSL